MWTIFGVVFIKATFYLNICTEFINNKEKKSHSNDAKCKINSKILQTCKLVEIKLKIVNRHMKLPIIYDGKKTTNGRTKKIISNQCLTQSH